jgi:hypothetical protein
VESEELARRIAAEPDNRARIRKAYQLVYGRNPKEEEIQLGVAYLHEEPLKEYEENKNKPPEGDGRGGPDATKPEAPPTAAAAGEEGGAGSAAPEPTAPMGMGMMGGMAGPGLGGRAARPVEVKYEPTAWGRYVKVLFSASEFFFIN